MAGTTRPAIVMHLTAGTDGSRGWWAARLQSGTRHKVFAGPSHDQSLNNALDQGLRQPLSRLKQPCAVRLYGPPLMSCPERIEDHLLEHVATPTEGGVFDDLRRVGSAVMALTPLPPGRENLAPAYATCVPALAAWLAVVVTDDGTFAQVISGVTITTEPRLALTALAEGVRALPAPPTPLCFVSDGDYVLNGQEGLFRWPANNWANAVGQPLKNVELISKPATRLW